MSTTTMKASDPGSAWFGSGARTRSAAGISHNARLVTTAVAAFVSVLGRGGAVRPPTTAAAAAAPKRGLDPAAVAALPTVLYRDAGGADDGAECTICLGAVQEGELVRALPACGHVFHVPCVDTWFASSSSCPVCRAEVEPPPPPPALSSSARFVQAEKAAQDAVKEEAGSSTPERGIGACASLMKMLSRERPAPRRPHADAGDLDDLERQQHSVAVNN
jgi:E3 ubiquitin-protein ligase ATL41